MTNEAKIGDCIIITKSNGLSGSCKILDKLGERECRADVASLNVAADIAYAWRDEGGEVWEQVDEMKPDALKPYKSGSAWGSTKKEC